MERVSPEELLGSPVGKWAATGCSVVWCHSPTLGGVIGWGRATAADAEASLRLVDLYRHPSISPCFQIVMDGYSVDGVDPSALELFIGWLTDRREELRRRISLRVGIVPRGILGALLSDIMPVSGESHPFRVFAEPLDGLRAVAPAFADDLHRELQAASEQAQGLTGELRRLREVLRARSGDLSLDQAAHTLGSSPRSLQRALSSAGVSFRHEQLAARCAAACHMLTTTDLKVSAIAARLGITDRALGQLFSSKSLPSPGAFRRVSQRA